jgi:2'-5' RNA ligase
VSTECCAVFGSTDRQAARATCGFQGSSTLPRSALPVRVSRPLQRHPCNTLVMSRQLPAHLSHTSALALLPPASITAPIEAVRRVHDKHFARWPPHINLLYPFLASPSELAEQGQENPPPKLKEDIRIRIREATESIAPFKISLNVASLGMFSHSKRSKTVWLGPTTKPVQQLQAALQLQFEECDADNRRFTPHLSLGQSNSDYAAKLLGEEFKNSVANSVTRNEVASVALDWYVDRVFVIERKGYHGRFKVVGSVELCNP